LAFAFAFASSTWFMIAFISELGVWVPVFGFVIGFEF
jgi:hypothetical protein